MAVHEFPLVASNDDYTDRWVSPEGIVVRGSFRHNRHSSFRVTVLNSPEAYSEWWGGGTPGNGIGDLAAMATVISSPPAPVPEIVTAAVGDVLRTPQGDFEIRDDWPLHDPYLVRV